MTLIKKEDSNSKLVSRHLGLVDIASEKKKNNSHFTDGRTN